MLSVGVDLSAEVRKTYVAEVVWSDSRAEVRHIAKHADDDDIVLAAQRADIVGIDCPFGWPSAFVDFVTEHRAGAVAAREGQPIEWRRRLAKRETDLRVREMVSGAQPLSVSADRIAHVAFRCAALLAGLETSGVPVDRSGQTGKVVEVYPAASLRRWFDIGSGYKGAQNTRELSQLLDRLLDEAPWLEISDDHKALCASNDDAFDAVITALTARAAWAGLTEGPGSAERHAAKVEGWIAVPEKDSLAGLAHARARATSLGSV